MRPANGLSSDAGFNLASAICAACHPELADAGVVAVLGGEIHAVRDVTKESTYRLNSFGSGELGPLGYVDASGEVVLYRKSCRRVAPFNLQRIKSFARVDVAFAYAGADGTEIAAFLKGGASGLVVAGMAPGTCGPLQLAALEAAAGQGVAISFSSRSGHGRVLESEFLRSRGFLAADNLSPQKARILLALALSSDYPREQLQTLFDRS
jgi:L-asparaginase